VAISAWRRSLWAGRSLPGSPRWMLEGTERLPALGAVGLEPLTDWPLGHAEEFGDLVRWLSLGDPEDSGETLSDALVVDLATAAFEFLAA
jgi:hypothetical protein